MSTRGAIGFRKNNQDYAIYNHYDSYPSNLGTKVLNFIKANTISTLNNIADVLLLNSDNAILNNSCIPSVILDHIHDIEKENQKDFLYDSLFCEYAYILNLDTQELEFYTGFNTIPFENKGRYAMLGYDNGYYGVVLTKRIPLSVIQNNDISLSEIITLLEKRSKKIRIYADLAKKKQIGKFVSLIKESIDLNISQIKLSLTTMLELINGLNLKTNDLSMNEIQKKFFRLTHNNKRYQLQFHQSNDNTQKLDVISINIIKE